MAINGKWKGEKSRRRGQKPPPATHQVIVPLHDPWLQDAMASAIRAPVVRRCC
jgi:hypothetical protein